MRLLLAILFIGSAGVAYGQAGHLPPANQGPVLQLPELVDGGCYFRNATLPATPLCPAGPNGVFVFATCGGGASANPSSMNDPACTVNGSSESKGTHWGKTYPAISPMVQQVVTGAWKWRVSPNCLQAKSW